MLPIHEGTALGFKWTSLLNSEHKLVKRQLVALVLSCCLLQGLRTTSLKEFIIKRSRTVRNKLPIGRGEKNVLGI